VPIIAGSSSLCGTHRKLFHHGNEGEGLGWSHAEKLAAWQPVEGHEAAEFLYSKCAEFVGEVTIVMTGSASLTLGLPFCTKDLIPTRVILGIAALRGYNLTPQMICSVRWLGSGYQRRDGSAYVHR
jgi:hypothetical protein